MARSTTDADFAKLVQLYVSPAALLPCLCSCIVSRVCVDDFAAAGAADCAESDAPRVCGCRLMCRSHPDSCRHAFGVRGGIRDTVAFTSDTTVMYPVGQHMVLYNAETKKCQFLQKSKNSIQVPSRSLVAVSVAVAVTAASLSLSLSAYSH
jgi:hypothetical protein